MFFVTLMISGIGYAAEVSDPRDTVYGNDPLATIRNNNYITNKAEQLGQVLNREFIQRILMKKLLHDPIEQEDLKVLDEALEISFQMIEQYMRQATPICDSLKDSYQTLKELLSEQPLVKNNVLDITTKQLEHLNVVMNAYNSLKDVQKKENSEKEKRLAKKKTGWWTELTARISKAQKEKMQKNREDIRKERKSIELDSKLLFIMDTIIRSLMQVFEDISKAIKSS
jgi:hypothetical protein